MHRLLAVLVVLVACGGKLYHQVDVGGGKRIYEGMSSEQITGVMGRPDNVSSGMSRDYASEFLFSGEELDSGWIEWAWQRPGKIYVAYMHGGFVKKVGIVTVDEGK